MLGNAGEEHDVVEIVNPRVGSFDGGLGACVQLLGDLIVDAEHHNVAARTQLHSVEIDGVRDVLEQLERAGFGFPQSIVANGLSR